MRSCAMQFHREHVALRRKLWRVFFDVRNVLTTKRHLCHRPRMILKQNARLHSTMIVLVAAVFYSSYEEGPS